MAREMNGRFRPFDEDKANEDDFPLSEKIEDCARKERHFTIRLRDVQLGYLLEAEEEGTEGLGYLFSAFDSTSPYLALGALRDKMRRVMGTRHLTTGAGGATVFGDTLRGRITATEETDGPIFVVDGVPLSLDTLGRIVETHEGFEFVLRFVDPA